jgi:hypothetical protein
MIVKRIAGTMLLLVLSMLCFFPVHADSQAIALSTQRFEHGLMIFRSDNADVWVLFDGGKAYLFNAPYYNTLSDQTPINNPGNHILPLFSFGRIWRNLNWVQNALGWPSLPEIGYYARLTSYAPDGQLLLEFPQLDSTIIYVTQSGASYTWAKNLNYPNPRIYSTQAAFQPYDNGYMIWRADTQEVLVLPGKTAGQAMIYPVAVYGPWPDNDVTAAPPAGHVKPIDAFGRIWRTWWPDQLGYMGWPTAPEQGYSATVTELNASLPLQSAYTITIPDGRKVSISMGYSYTNWDLR